MHVLESYEWPGNVRELRNALAYAYVIGEGPVLEPADLPPELTEGEPWTEVSVASSAPEAEAEPVSSSVPAGEARRISQALTRTRGHKAQAAQLLGISRITLWRRMRDLGLIDST